VAFPLEGRGLEPEVIDRRVAELLDMLEVAQYADALPADLSTGMKRAVAIARALAQEPDAILYDEPTTMVDPIMAGHVSELIRKLKESFHKTSVVVTHDTHLARKLADRVVFLQDGKVAYFGPWAQFENTAQPFLRNFLLQDALVPALDQTV
jgi:phospholipid/cholesterol/gamma-HCH transport system ATP-binding protein